MPVRSVVSHAVIEFGRRKHAEACSCHRVPPRRIPGGLTWVLVSAAAVEFWVGGFRPQSPLANVFLSVFVPASLSPEEKSGASRKSGTGVRGDHVSGKPPGARTDGV